ncbi:MAG: aldehyde dehydrogenase family protein [Nostocoides sp.]
MTERHLASIDWAAAAAAQPLPSGLVIGGDVVPAQRRHTLITPRDGGALGEVPWAGPIDADRAVAAARQAFDTGPWPRMHPRERGDILLRVADELERHRDELALLVSMEMGKPIRQAWSIELKTFIRTWRYYGELADKGHGEITPTGPGELALVTREPAGVVAAVVPWNFPLTLAGWKVTPALAAGCTVVLKTSELAPLSMLRVGELALAAGLPQGVLNVLTGDGEQVGRRLGEHLDVDVLTFTGSTAVGRHFLRYAANSNLKRVYLELGGKSPNIIFPDAPDLQQAASMAAWAIFFNSGEMCTAGSRLILHRDIADTALDMVLAATADWAPGDPLDPVTTMGPMVNEASLTRVLGQLEEGLADGAELLAGGQRIGDGSAGPYMQPTVVAGLTQENILVREELFAPVLSTFIVDSEQEAVAVAGNTAYGLAGAVWTSDLGRALRVSRAIRAGTVWVNCYEEGDLSVPFGGVKLSGFGRDKSAHAMAGYTDLKTTWIVHG